MFAIIKGSSKMYVSVHIASGPSCIPGSNLARSRLKKKQT